MARIRTIKPEFWDSPDTARASHTARLFFIALWNWADDYGKGTASAKQLIGFAFPNDDNITVADYPRLASELQSAWKVVFYEVEGRPFYYLPAFAKHQRTEKKAASRIPDPPDDVPAGQTRIDEPSDDSGGSSDANEGRSVPGTGEQGNRGTGESSTALTLVDGSESGEKMPRGKKATRIPEPWIVDEAMKDWARERNMQPQWVMKHTERFVLYWKGIGGQRGTKLDWRSTWKNWLLKAQDESPPTPEAAGPRTFAKDDVRARFQ